MTTPELPAALLRNLADSELEVRLWDMNELVLRIVKDIGEESGLIRFRGVSHVSLPPRLEVAGIRIVETSEIPSYFFDQYRPDEQQLDDGEHFYSISGSWGESYFVVASNVEYFIDF